MKKKRKRSQRLPNGFGSVVFLGEGRRRPYAVYLPVRERDYPQEAKDAGIVLKRKVLCYVATREAGIAVLSLFHSGQYHDGVELELEAIEATRTREDGEKMGRMLKHVVRAYNSMQNIARKLPEKKVFGEVFYEWLDAKTAESTLSDASLKNIRIAFEKSAYLHDMPIDEIKGADINRAVDENTSPSTVSRQKQVIKAVYRFALMQGYVEKNIGELALSDRRDNYRPAKSERMTDAEIATLWKNVKDDDAQLTLIMIYSGGRCEEYRDFQVNLDELYFKGGSKTESGRNRIVPIHSAIAPLVRDRIAKYGCLMPLTYAGWRHRFNAMKKRYNLNPALTTHDCRSTFTSLAIASGISLGVVDLIVGHKTKSLTLDVYTHLSVEELRREIEKIKVLFPENRPV